MSKRKSKKMLKQATDVVEDIVPAVEQGLESAYESAKDVFSEGRDRASDAFAEVASESKRRLGRGKKKQKGKRTLRKLLVLGLLAGVGAAIFKTLQGKQQQSSHSPAPANTPAPSTPKSEEKNDVPQVPASPSVTQPDDRAGAAPGEALSDAGNGTAPRPTTTPDAPAEVVDVEKNEE